MSSIFVFGSNIMVFGANRQGRHGKGAALHARVYYGAIYGQAEGRQGNSYAIITKELRRGYPPVLLEEVRQGVDKFLFYAYQHPELDFTIANIGCGLAGFVPAHIAPLFKGYTPNVQLPPDWIVLAR